MSSDVFVFCGPTIDAAGTRAILPGAEVLPPARRGDLIRLSPRPGDTVVLLDGYYFHAAAIQHMELLWALDRGVTLVGAASIGALRAVELRTEGMQGVGTIVQWYLSGVINGDDEVALLHSPDTYACTSDALVNIRYNLGQAVERGVLAPSVERAVLGALKSMWFGDRSHGAALRWLRAHGHTEEESNLRVFLTEHGVDLKRRDAEAALRHVRDGRPEGRRVEGRRPATCFLADLEREFSPASPDGCFTERDVVTLCQILEDDIEELLHRSALEELTGLPSPPDLAALEVGCHRVLVERGEIHPAAPVSIVAALLRHPRHEPGVPAVQSLTSALERRGSLERARARLAAVAGHILHGANARDARTPPAPRAVLAALYSRLWRIDPSRLPEEARRRGLGDLDRFMDAAAGRVLVGVILDELARRAEPGSRAGLGAEAASS